MRSRLFLSVVFLALLLPSSAFALEGIGPRVTVSGTVEGFLITPKQAFDQVGGEFYLRATNGQLVTVVFTKETEIISEGRLSRKQLIPANITKDMSIRVRGWRVDSKTLTASLFIIQNIEMNPGLNANGTLQSIGNGSVSVLLPNGKVYTYAVTNETDVIVNFTLRGTEGLSLTSKQVLLTLNPTNTSQVRILRITGEKALR